MSGRDKGAAAAGQDDRLHFGSRWLLMQSKMPPRTAASVRSREDCRRDDGNDVMTFELDNSFNGTLLAILSLPISTAEFNSHLERRVILKHVLIKRTPRSRGDETSRQEGGDRSQFVVALSAALMCCAHFIPTTGLLGNQEMRPVRICKQPFRVTYTLTRLGYLTPVPRFREVSAGASAMALGYAPCNLGFEHIVRGLREEVCARPAARWRSGGATAQHDLLRQSRNGTQLGVQLDVGSRNPIATTAMGRAYIWAWQMMSVHRYCASFAALRQPLARECATASTRGETVARMAFTISAGNGGRVHAVGVALKLMTEPVLMRSIAERPHSLHGRTVRNDIGLVSWRW